MTIRNSLILPILIIALLFGSLPARSAKLVSVNAAGTAAGNSQSFNASLSANGRFVAFQSTATDLVPGGTPRGEIFVRDLLTGTTVLASVNVPPYIGMPAHPRLSADGRYLSYQRPTCTFIICPTADIFVRDLQVGVTTLVSVGLDGLPAGGGVPEISQDGRHVAFASASANLVPNDSNGTVDIFVRDLDAGITRLVSVNAAGAGSGNGLSGPPSLSADGRFVAFQSDASDLVAGDTNGRGDVFVRDIQAGITYLASINATGTGSGNSGSGFVTLSADGSRVAFGSDASDLVATDTNGDFDVFVRDLPSGPTRLVSLNLAGTDSGNDSSFRGYLTYSGRFVAFQSFANDLVNNDPNISQQDVFLRDVDAGVTRLASVNTSGTSSFFSRSELFLRSFEGVAGFEVASDDGRFVVFSSDAPGLVSGVSPACPFTPCEQIYRRDFQAGVTTLLSVDPTGSMTGNDTPESFGGLISADGRVAIFETSASNLTPLPDTNGFTDVFFDGEPLGPSIVEVPTLGSAGLALLTLLTAGLGIRSLRRRSLEGGR
ncbi:MAG: hypothetical protein QOF89_4618 [Acidobacteriota bacterium]|jgi:Tol biopolymer transport system component|nr:hypothetical protein [Acidobacteriota bacterium]